MPDAAKPPSQEELLAEARSFHQSFASLLMATARPDGEPNASYAPYVTDKNGFFFIYVSELAIHTANLKAYPRLSILFIEDEREDSNLFARKRMTYTCTAEEIGRETPAFAGIMDRFEARHGQLISLLRKLHDFHLFRLVPEHATYVRGFAQAFKLTGEELGGIRAVQEKGHQPEQSVPMP